MRPLKFLFLIFIVGCSSTNVVYDYDSKTDFKAYKTFNFFEDAGEGLNELDVKRIANELSNGLHQKGMQMSEDPDMYINVISKEGKTIDRSTIGIGMGGGRNVSFGVSGGIPIGSKKINQKLIIDFVKSENDELLWQGISNGSIKERTTPEERLIHYKKTIEKILMNYPPKK